MTSEVNAVLELLSQHAGVQIEDNEDCRAKELTELGISSVTFMVVIVELEDILGRPFEDADAFAEVKTVGDLLRALGLE
jgi:acyl carrier protein